MTTEGTFELPATSRVGRVALRVGSLDRVVAFYRDLGFRAERDGRHARLRAGGETLVRLREDPDAPGRGRDEAGLFHLAVRVPDRGALAAALSRVRGAGLDLTGASDHLVSEALYLRDPEGNGVEVYRDRPRGEWPRTDDGGVEMDTLALDLDELAAAGDGGGGDVEEGLPAGTDVGHVHLEVADLGRAESFYVGGLGLNVRARYGGGAAFLAAGDYHHHVGLNTWNGRTAPAGEGRGLVWFELVLPDDGALCALREHLDGEGFETGTHDGAVEVRDPDGVRVRLSAGG